MSHVKKHKKLRYVGIPYHVVASKQYCTLSAHAKLLLWELSFQRNGHNNGKLSACWTLIRERGWSSSSTLYKAYSELQKKGFVVVTRRGKKLRGHPTLCAVTWDGIDECGVEYDENISPTPVPLNYWRKAEHT